MQIGPQGFTLSGLNFVNHWALINEDLYSIHLPILCPFNMSGLKIMLEVRFVINFLNFFWISSLLKDN